METTQERMRAVARAITHAGEDEQELLAMLCAAQEAALDRALREGVRQEDCEETFICAGGMLAAAAMENARAGGEALASLRAGDVTLTGRSAGEGSEHARLLTRQAWALMRPYTKEGDFYFCRV